ncbi:MAG: helix-turn-helix domain-containing protein [Spirochaetales bacterium]
MAYEYEVIKHEEGTDFRVFLVSIEQRLHHWHADIEVLLILQGSVIVEIAGAKSVLHHGDIFVINRNEVHNLVRTKEANVLLALQFHPKFCHAYEPLVGRIRFQTRHLKGIERPQGWLALRRGLLQLAVDSFSKEPGNSLKTMGQLNQLVFTLIDQLEWAEDDEAQLAAEGLSVLRLKRVLDYLESNFSGRVSLSQLAEQEGLEMTYLSHFISDHLGISFQAYLTKLRLERAILLIHSTRKSLIDICLDCGFSDTRYMTKAFLADFGCTPLEYRHEYRNSAPLFRDPVKGGQHRFLEPAVAMQLVGQALATSSRSSRAGAF